MSYYQFNRQELLQKTKDRYHNCGGIEKTAKYYIENKEVLKENARNKYRNSSEEKKEIKRKYEINKYRNMTENEKAS